MEHLARKLAVAIMRSDQLYVALNAWRYLGWQHVEMAAEGRTAGRVESVRNSRPSLNTQELASRDFVTALQAVLRDIAERFPEISKAEH